jgi:hypothetical protein
MALIAILLVNGLVAAICGLRCRMLILIPLVTAACAEVVFLKRDGIGWSPVWLTIVLIAVVEAGYLAGASVGTLWLNRTRARVPRGIAPQGYRGTSVFAGK